MIKTIKLTELEKLLNEVNKVNTLTIDYFLKMAAFSCMVLDLVRIITKKGAK